jgi:hypothetical protein
MPNLKSEDEHLAEAGGEGEGITVGGKMGGSRPAPSAGCCGAGGGRRGVGGGAAGKMLRWRRSGSSRWVPHEDSLCPPPRPLALIQVARWVLWAATVGGCMHYFSKKTMNSISFLIRSALQEAGSY